MASLITHPLVPIVAATIVGRKIVPLSLVAIGVVFAMLPDADGITFRLGIPYASQFGHRGFTHSISFAFLMALMVVPFIRSTGAKPLAAFLFLFASMVSHGVLDAFTNRGNGVAFFWPLSLHRYFFGFHPVEASPVSVQRFLTQRGLEILQSEFIWIWAPSLLIALIGYCIRKRLEESGPLDTVWNTRALISESKKFSEPSQ